MCTKSSVCKGENGSVTKDLKVLKEKLKALCENAVIANLNYLQMSVKVVNPKEGCIGEIIKLINNSEMNVVAFEKVKSGFDFSELKNLKKVQALAFENMECVDFSHISQQKNLIYINLIKVNEVSNLESLVELGDLKIFSVNYGSDFTPSHPVKRETIAQILPDIDIWIDNEISA